ncbi:peptide-methionine (S)-S-oxide reductase MsrA [Kushneria phosphatilytica]|uniref:Peptide methionine sulfoxide reductase MsrA n=1 Tax=Kushneria phosphatilytica TaxID=657387 RepID=A0A1S1NRP4_9GAMM|nr:peptide-methionine (S)-S-oxide reductase MsrA [Kushneria phosphatilytica]OHV11934.1 peptide-methionine (S)-S-oxide reductase [Kushneria phosphatilytica]QEL11116.1 peptide-methionine (S)-S-oxide reductase MsrA [Kushneria phosphatilytica]
MLGRDKTRLPDASQALPGRDRPIDISGEHHVTGHSIVPPFPPHSEELVLGMGCFWGAERLFWSLPGVYATAAGYADGITPNPTYEEVCSGMTGHAEVVRIIYDPTVIGTPELLRLFWESHDPTQGMRQGNDLGTQYRSVILTTSPAQRQLVEQSRDEYARALQASGNGTITTEIHDLETFYYAEEYHQQYLSKNPAGYCGLRGTGVSCPIF